MKRHQWNLTHPVAGDSVAEGTREEVRRQAIRALMEGRGMSFIEAAKGLRIRRADLGACVLYEDGTPTHVVMRDHDRTEKELQRIAETRSKVRCTVASMPVNGWARFSVGHGEDGPQQFLALVDGPGYGVFPVTFALLLPVREIGMVAP